MKIISGRFTDGNYVTVEINGKEYKRKAYYGGALDGGTYILFNGKRLYYDSFEDVSPDSWKNKKPLNYDMFAGV